MIYLIRAGKNEDKGADHQTATVCGAWSRLVPRRRFAGLWCGGGEAQEDVLCDVWSRPPNPFNWLLAQF